MPRPNWRPEVTLRHRSDTIVIQSFRDHSVPRWIQTCLDSVRNWAALFGHDYELSGDEFYDLCGPEYLARGNKNPQAKTNLARLVAARQKLDAGYAKVIWIDADAFVFDPQRLVLDFPSDVLGTGYAFGREVWITRGSWGVPKCVGPMAHNAAMFFTSAAVDLDMLIALIRHIDARRTIVSNYQVGVNLLRGLQYSLMFPTFSHVGVFSPDLIRALAKGDKHFLKSYGKIYRYPCCAANLGLSIQHETSEQVLLQVMDRLAAGTGRAINMFMSESEPQLVP